jgi:hypothetical protein
VKPAAAAAAVDAVAGEAEALAVVEAALRRRHAHRLKALAGLFLIIYSYFR